MKICLVGDFSDNLDEGFKNTSHYLAKTLEDHHTVVRLNVKQVRSAAFWRDALRARPDIIHTIAQPTDQSLLLTRMLRARWPRARTVVSALRAERYFQGGAVGLRRRALLQALRPDLVLAQSAGAEALFRRSGCVTVQLPNGVDLHRFVPASPERKRELRAKYGIAPDRPAVLHVGHLEAARNLTALEQLLAKQIQLVVAGSLYMGTNHELIERLEGAGFHLFKGYQPHVEELYMLADCYVFPAQPGNSITMPLSVLEAMACNLPVVTTRFVGLQELFQTGGGFQFADDPGRIPEYVEAALRSGAACHTREMVKALSWQAIAERLEGHYERLVAA
jgi:glycosyltransferase involved in cell wall biosynthesis